MSYGRDNAPSLSIVTPVYNAARYIDETAKSVTSQMTADDQYVIVDDGSQDGSGDIVASLGGAIELVRQANAGEEAAVNAGVAAVRHDIVGIVNADDPILPGLLDEVRAAFAADDDLAAVYPDWLKIDAEGRTIAEIKTYEFDYAVLLAQHMCIPGPGAFFRNSVLAKEPVRLMSAHGISDYDFWLRFGRHGAKIRRIPRTLATWRLHAAGATISSQGTALAQMKVRVIERLLADPTLPAEVKALGPRALSAAYNHAALVGLRARGVPALRYAIRSYLLAPRWPDDVLPHQRRSLTHLVYAAMQPLSGALHDVLGPLLPPRLRRQAVLDQVFALDVPATR